MRAADRVVIAREAHAGDRLQRVHDADHVRRPELRLDEARDLLAAGHARPPADVVVVQEEREQPHIVARRFDFLVDVGANLPRRRRSAVRIRPPSSSMSLNVSIFCGLPSSVISKSACLRSATGCAVLVGDDDVDADEVDAAAEDRAAAGRRLLRSAAGRVAPAAGWLLLPPAALCARSDGAGQQHAPPAACSRERPWSLS